MYATGQQLLCDAEMVGVHESFVQKILIGIRSNRNHSVEVIVAVNFFFKFQTLKISILHAVMQLLKKTHSMTCHWLERPVPTTKH